MRKNYEIGYKKPPQSSQFKPGESGNPKGRPKGANDMMTALENELDQTVNIKVNGISKKVPMRIVIAKRVTKAAADGDLKAISLLLKHQRPKIELEEFEVTAEDEAALKELEDFLMNKKSSS